MVAGVSRRIGRIVILFFLVGLIVLGGSGLIGGPAPSSGNHPRNGYLWLNPHHKALFTYGTWVGGTIYAAADSPDDPSVVDDKSDGYITDTATCDGNGDIVTSDSDLIVGDTSNADCIRSVLKFGISGLSGVTVTSASMSVYLYQSMLEGNPYTDSPLANPGLGDLNVIHIGDYTTTGTPPAPDVAAYQLSSTGNDPSTPLISSSATPDVGYVGIDIAAAMQQDIDASHSFAGYRLQLGTPNNDNFAEDQWLFKSWTTAEDPDQLPKIDYAIEQTTTVTTTSTFTSTEITTTSETSTQSTTVTATSTRSSTVSSTESTSVTLTSTIPTSVFSTVTTVPVTATKTVASVTATATVTTVSVTATTPVTTTSVTSSSTVISSLTATTSSAGDVLIQASYDRFSGYLSFQGWGFTPGGMVRGYLDDRPVSDTGLVPPDGRVFGSLPASLMPGLHTFYMVDLITGKQSGTVTFQV